MEKSPYVLRKVFEFYTVHGEYKWSLPNNATIVLNAHFTNGAVGHPCDDRYMLTYQENHMRALLTFGVIRSSGVQYLLCDFTERAEDDGTSSGALKVEADCELTVDDLAVLTGICTMWRTLALAF